MAASVPARELAQISPKRIAAQAAASCALAVDGTAAFVYLVRQKIETADVLARESYLGTVISEIGFGEHSNLIKGDEASSVAIIATQHAARRKH